MGDEPSMILPLQLSKVSVRKRGKLILDSIDFKLDEDGFTIVMGPNGSGKTTLLRLMHGLERARSGTVNWAVDTALARRRQAFVFQTPVMMRRSVLDNIAYPLLLQKVPKANARDSARHWAQSVHLERRLELDAQLLSGGERQKLAIARALIVNPQVLFLDEPTTNLDGQSMREIEAIVKEVARKGTRIVMTTHDTGQARRLADEVVFLNRGKICEHRPSQEFFVAPDSIEAKTYLQGDIVE